MSVMPLIPQPMQNPIGRFGNPESSSTNAPVEGDIAEATLPDGVMIPAQSEPVPVEHESAQVLELEDGRDAAAMGVGSEQAPTRGGRLQKVSTAVGNLAMAAVLAVEMTPVLNEAVRGAIVTATELGNGNPLKGMAAWFLGTLAFEGAGAAIITRMLHTPKGAEQVDRFRDSTSSVGGVRTNKIGEAAIGVVAGSPLLTFVKHQQYRTEERTVTQDLKYGLTASVLVSAAGTVNTSPVIEGVSKLATESSAAGWSLLGGGAVALGGAMAWGKHKFDQLRHKANEASIAAYRTYYDETSTGPQVEGMFDSEIRGALEDKRTLSLLLSETGERVPVLTPLEHNEEFRPAYFDERYPGRPVYYASKIIAAVDLESTYFVNKAAKKIRQLAEQGAIIVTDYREDDEAGADGLRRLEEIMNAAGVTYTQNNFVDTTNNSPTSVVHYAGKGRLNDRELGVLYDSPAEAFADIRWSSPEDYNREDGTMLITSENMDDGLLEAVWDMYSERFEDLMAQNPCMQKQTKEDLFTMLRNEGTLMAAKFRDGNPICVAYLVRDISTAYWLRADYYQEAFPGEDIWYFPAIAAKKGMEGERHSVALVDLLVKLAAATRSEPVIAFQNTNLSKDYIRGKVVQDVINGMGQYTIQMDQLANYRYVGYELSTAGATE